MAHLSDDTPALRSAPLDREEIVALIFASIYRPQPCMSGRVLDRASPHQRRGCEDAADAILARLAARPAQGVVVPDELRALSEKATSGEWLHGVGDNYYVEALAYPKDYPHRFKEDDTGPHLLILGAVGNREADFGEANSKFIVAAVNFVRSLLAPPTSEPSR